MPDYKPNPVVRVIAVVALVAAFVLVVAVIATSGGGSSDGNGHATTAASGPTKEGRKALSNGVWVVHPGDTLGKISEETGIDVDKLVQLNPDLDPQTLLQGQRIALR